MHRHLQNHQDHCLHADCAAQPIMTTLTLHLPVLQHALRLVLISMVCSVPLTESHSMHYTLSRLVQSCSKQGNVLAGKRVVLDTMQHSV